MSIGIAIRDRKGRDVAVAPLYESDFRVDIRDGIRIVIGEIPLGVTAKGRGPFTWHIGDVYGTCSATVSRVRPGDTIHITPTISVSAVKA